MLFEAQMVSPHPSPYQQHLYLIKLFAHLDGEPYPVHRKFSWCESNGMLYVRRTIPTNDIPWQPVSIPRAGSMINFELQARCRRSFGRRREPPDPKSLITREVRPNITDPIKLLRWMHRNGEAIGLQVEDAEVELSTRFVAKTGISRRGVKYGFTQVVANFQGFATVRDPQQFAQGLTSGIGDSKAFGLGFMFFWERGSPDAAQNHGSRHAGRI